MVDNDFWFLGTQWPPFTGGSMDIAEPIDVSVASRIVPYSHLAAFWLTSSSVTSLFAFNYCPRLFMYLMSLKCGSTALQINNVEAMQ